MADGYTLYCTSHAAGHVPFYLHAQYALRSARNPELLDLVAVTDYGIVVAAIGEGGVPVIENWHMHGMARRIASAELKQGKTVIERLPSLIACIGDYVVTYSLKPVTTECKRPTGGHGHQRRTAL